jgi:hypothetical protein
VLQAVLSIYSHLNWSLTIVQYMDKNIDVI